MQAFQRQQQNLRAQQQAGTANARNQQHMLAQGSQSNSSIINRLQQQPSTQFTNNLAFNRQAQMQQQPQLNTGHMTTLQGNPNQMGNSGNDLGEQPLSAQEELSRFVDSL